MEVYLHFRMCLYGIVLNNTGGNYFYVFSSSVGIVSEIRTFYETFLIATLLVLF